MPPARGAGSRPPAAAGRRRLPDAPWRSSRLPGLGLDALALLLLGALLGLARLALDPLGFGARSACSARRSASTRSASACSAATRSASACSAAARSASARSASACSAATRSASARSASACSAATRSASARSASACSARRPRVGLGLLGLGLLDALGLGTRSASTRSASARSASASLGGSTRSASACCGTRSASTRSASAARLDALGLGPLGLDALGLDPLGLGLLGSLTSLQLGAVALLLLGALLRRLALGGLAGLELLQRDDGQHQLDPAGVLGLDLGDLDERRVRHRDQPGVEQAHHDLTGLEEREPALAGQLGDAARAVDLAEQRPLVRAERDLVRRRGSSQGRDRVRAAGRGEDGLPGRGAVAQVVEELGHRRRRGDVLAGLLVLAELPGGHRPAQQVGQGVLEVLDDELLDHRELDVAQVHEQLAQPPALQLGALDLQRLGEGLRGQGAAGHQADAEHHPAAGHVDGVDLAVPEVDLGLVALLVADEQAAGGAGVRQVAQHGLDGVGEEGTLGHEPTSFPESGQRVTGPPGWRSAADASGPSIASAGPAGVLSVVQAPVRASRPLIARVRSGVRPGHDTMPGWHLLAR